MVKDCLEECDLCELTLQQAIPLDLERKQLENEELKREIELMDTDPEARLPQLTNRAKRRECAGFSGALVPAASLEW